MPEASGNGNLAAFDDRAAEGHHDLKALPGGVEVAGVDFFVVVQPIGHFLDVGGHVQVVIHRALAAAGAGFGHGPPAAAGHDFGKAVGALRADAAFAPPIGHFGHVRRARPALEDAVDAVGKMNEAGDVIGRGMGIGQLAATGRLGHDPLGLGAGIEPEHVIHQVA